MRSWVKSTRERRASRQASPSDEAVEAAEQVEASQKVSTRCRIGRAAACRVTGSQHGDPRTAAGTPARAATGRARRSSVRPRLKAQAPSAPVDARGRKSLGGMHHADA